MQINIMQFFLNLSLFMLYLTSVFWVPQHLLPSTRPCGISVWINTLFRVFSLFTAHPLTLATIQDLLLQNKWTDQTSPTQFQLWQSIPTHQTGSSWGTPWAVSILTFSRTALSSKTFCADGNVLSITHQLSIWNVATVIEEQLLLLFHFGLNLNSVAAYG